MVRLKKMFRGKIPGEDQILILEGLNSAGDLNVQVWKDGLTSPMSLLPYKTGAFVAQGSEIFFLDDADGDGAAETRIPLRSEEHTSELQSRGHLVCRLLLEK